jgi:hypothetical protein
VQQTFESITLNNPPYNDLAAECRKMAARTANLEYKKVLQEMAAAWDTVGKERDHEFRKRKPGREAETFALIPRPSALTL